MNEQHYVKLSNGFFEVIKWNKDDENQPREVLYYRIKRGKKLEDWIIKKGVGYSKFIISAKGNIESFVIIPHFIYENIRNLSINEFKNKRYAGKNVKD